MTDKEPNLYDKEAYKSGYEAFLKRISVVSNPYHCTKEEGLYNDWRIGYATARYEKQINKKQGS